MHSAGVLSSFGDGDVYGVIRAIDRVLADIGEVDIVVMSFGTNLVGDKPGLFGSELTRVLGDALGVAAAGNQSTCRPYFPAALPDVIGVGGLAADGKAWFTNFGGWVDACAPAIDVVSTFFNDFDETLHIKDSSGTVTPTRHPSLPGVGPMERHQLRRAEGGRADRSGDVPQRAPRPDRTRRLGPAHLVPPLPLPGPRHRLQRLTARVGLLSPSAGALPSAEKHDGASHGTPIRSTTWLGRASIARGCWRPRTSPSPTSPSTSSEPDTVVWVDFCGPSKEELHELADELGLHELAVEDALGPAPATEARPLRDAPVPVLSRGPARRRRGELDETEIDAFISKRWLITVRKDEGFSMDAGAGRWDRSPDLAVHGVSFLLYGLLDVVVDGYFDAVQGFDDFYDEVSEGIFSETPLDAVGATALVPRCARRSCASTASWCRCARPSAA